MTKEELIKAMEKAPNDAEVCIFIQTNARTLSRHVADVRVDELEGKFIVIECWKSKRDDNAVKAKDDEEEH